MTFVCKENVLFYFKIVAICLMITGLVCFVSTVFNEKKGVVSLTGVIEQSRLKSKMCMSEYVTYCGFALFLGAFVNVKRLVKLGIV
jgi:hypothetical protein